MSALERQLLGSGYEVTASAADADLCVLNSCAVTGEAARQSRQFARHMSRTNPAARLIVTGCYATLEGQSVAALPNVDLVVGNDRKRDLAQLIALSQGGNAPSPMAGNAATSAPRPGSRTRAVVKVQDGCRNRCTFCIVTLLRGPERSRAIRELVTEVSALHAAGYQEVVLTGVHLGGYGSDLGVRLDDLAAALLADTSVPRLRFSSLEPFDLAPRFFRLWAASGGRLMPHLHLPAQSGKDAVLRRMARRNSVAEFEALARSARECIPALTITTDLIAGFPGEDAAAFEETLAFARRMAFAHIHAFTYSARSGTAAARMSGRPPVQEARRRTQELVALSEALGLEVRRAFLGQQRPVLWENPSGSAGQATQWAGLTDNYLRVTVTAPAGIDLRNRITQASLVDVDAAGFHAEIVAPDPVSDPT
jgi:threonylcarbamoyladenosine tRNA methylthiotransferase MtaB